MRGLDTKVAVVTGASRGIGLGIAERLVAEGAKVVVTARKAEALAEAVEQLGGPEHALGIAGNAGDAAHRDEVVARTLETFGSIDLLVNNTGINPAYGPLVDLDLDVARKILDTNSVAALGWVQAVHAAWMKEHGAASVVNVSSVAGLKPAPGIAMYGASKATLISLTESLALELGAARPGQRRGPRGGQDSLRQRLYEGREEEVASAYPLKRLGEPEDIGSVVAFLLSDDAAG
ncbi:SDR family oxidoreductase [Nocardioides daphniae]|uniref:SDR family oxidoreductase n=1 Tax=Nocardioides daphniae TaxID=402297 RepID=UPI001EE8DD67|nr:SDR family oxidoreductase [Nocardioides daphniae]